MYCTVGSSDFDKNFENYNASWSFGLAKDSYKRLF
jgi:hypothetical protein